MPVIDEEGKKVTLPTKDRRPPKVTTPEPPKKGNVKWKSLILGGIGVHITSDFGMRVHPKTGKYKMHTGEDFGAPTGTVVKTPMAGIVTASGWDDAYGNYVTLRLNDGNYMFFAHLSARNVQKGQPIKIGTMIGKVGSTGSTTGPHLHLEIRRGSTGGRWTDDKALLYDPVDYLNGKAGKGRMPEGPGTVTTPDVSGQPAGQPTGDGGSTTTVIDGGGGGGGLGKVKFSKKDFYAQFEAAYGDLGILLQLDKEAVAEFGGKSIQWAIDQAVKQRLTGTIGAARLESLLNQTAFFKKYSPAISEKLVEERQKPALFADAVAQRAAAFTNVAAGYGVTVSQEALTKIGRNAYVYGWNDAQVLDAIQASAQEPGAVYTGGKIGEALEELDTQAYQYGVELTEADRIQLRNEVFDSDSFQATLDTIQERAAQTYSVFADQIRQGKSTRSLAGAYFTEAGKLLEQEPDVIDMDDPLFVAGKAFQTVDPKTGQIVMRTVADFRKMVKQDARWLTTNNAKAEAAELTTGILRRMGLV